MWGRFLVEDAVQDARFALRTFIKKPGFTLVAVFCLALGIGANAAIFSVVDAVLLKPLPYPQPERLVRLFETMPERGPDWKGSVSWPNYRDWAEQTRSFDGVAAYSLQGRNLNTPEGAERLQSIEATANLLPVLGVSPLLGRSFAPGEDAPGAPPVMLVSEGLWKRRFAADPRLVGQSLTLDGQPFTVIGILSETTRYPPVGKLDVVVPLTLSGPRAENRGGHSFSVLGRLRPGTSLTSANTELREVARRLAEAYPEAQSGRSALVVSLTETMVGRLRPALLILQGAVVLVLLIACANVSNLLMARSSGRRQEVALRFTLGASRPRLIRQMLMESLVLTLLGGLLGLAFALWGLASLQNLVQRALPLAGDVPLQGRVFLVLLLVAVGSAILVGLIPALQATRMDLRGALVSSDARTSATRGQNRFRSGLVVAEIAMSLVLLVGAGLLLRGFMNLLQTEPGFDTRNVLTAHLALPVGKYPKEQLPDRLLKPILERIQTLPGVKSASVISLLPIQGTTTSGSYEVEGQPPTEAGKELLAEYRVTAPAFFQTMGIPLRAGRDFTEQDGQGEQVVIVNQTLARKHFSEQNPTGRHLLLGGRPVTIIGVIEDVRQVGLEQPALPEIHLPYNHPQSSAWLFQEATLVVKTALAPERMSLSLREAVKAVDLDQPLDAVFPMEELVSRSMAGRQMNLVLLSIFALIALILAAAGLYGVIAYLVAQRTRELGIRIALGARPREVMRLVLRQGGGLVVLGLGVGVLLAFSLSRFIESMLFGVSANDPSTFLAFTVILGAVSTVAIWLPARRAARIDPIIAMRGE
ncbi:ABC transporter permease [Corallococcus exiguus]|uniref:ABC transporter permease n=1 Tax=Corallococcus exiguus TaxID=83462 RepID=UPI0014753F93|nr:ABC transporter permease [Corallococcus exiguus]NNB96853.1 ABC transporter permease [Corallococcus exiguus]